MIRKMLLAATVALAPVGAWATTLADSMTLAYRNSGLLDQNRALLRAADENVAQAVAALRPILNWQAGFTRSYTVNGLPHGNPGDDKIEAATAQAALSLSLLLHDHGRSQFAIDAAKEQVLATRANLVNIEQQVLLRAISAHMEVRRAQETLQLRRNNVRLIAEERRAARDRFDLGEVTRTDVSTAEASLAAARAQVAAAEGTLAQAREEYRAAVGQYPQNLRTPSAARPGRSESAARRYALANHPQVIAQRHTVSAAELSILQAEAAMKPRTSLSANTALRNNVMDDNRGTTFSQDIGVTIGGPIYQGGALSSVLRQAMAQRDAQRGQLHVVSDGVSQALGNAYATYEVTGLSINASRQQVEASRSAFNGIREEARLGSRTTIDVLDAEQNLLNARVALVSAQIDRVIASYNVLAAMGVLTAEDMKLPVQIYDPAAYYRLVERAPAVRSQQGQALDRVLRSIGQD